MARPTKQELMVIRQTSYKPPPERACATCEHINYFKDNCLAIDIRGVRQHFGVSPAGVCDLWEEKK